MSEAPTSKVVVYPTPWRLESRNEPIADTGDYDGVIMIKSADGKTVTECWNPGDDDEAAFLRMIEAINAYDGVSESDPQSCVEPDGCPTEGAVLQRHWREFKNFHRLLCERFGYMHDEKDWRRDQLSLIEHIAKRSTDETSGKPNLEAIRAVINEMISVAAQEDEDNIPDWTADNREQIDCWQAQLQDAIRQEETVDGLYIPVLLCRVCGARKSDGAHFQNCQQVRDALSAVETNAPRCAVCDHIEALHDQATTASHPFTPVKASGVNSCKAEGGDKCDCTPAEIQQCRSAMNGSCIQLLTGKQT